MDAVQKAESGPSRHADGARAAGLRALHAAPASTIPPIPHWPDRDRFVLSAGHASMLLYASLHLSGYDALARRDPAIPPVGEPALPVIRSTAYTPGVETTTGPLGQGVANAVGMAVAEAHLAAAFNQADTTIVDHHTWFICGDGDLMEGISHEAASLRRTLRARQADRLLRRQPHHDRRQHRPHVQRRCRRRGSRRYGWHVLHVADVNDLDALDAAIAEAQAETHAPVADHHAHRTSGTAARTAQDTAKAHGEALGDEEVALTKKKLGWPCHRAVLRARRSASRTGARGERGAALANDAWRRSLIAYAQGASDDAKELGRRLQGELPGGWEQAIPTFTAENGNVATRAASGVVLNALAPKVPELIGGSADLTRSNLTIIKDAPTLQRREPRRPQHPLRRSRARHGRHHERHGAARRHHSVRRHVPDLRGLHAARHSPRGAHAAARDLRLHARLDRPGRRRSDAPAHRAPHGAARDSEPDA